MANREGAPTGNRNARKHTEPLQGFHAMISAAERAHIESIAAHLDTGLNEALRACIRDYKVTK